MKVKLDYGNTTINYSVVKTKRRKTSEIIVDKDIVEIRAPFNKSDLEIRNIITANANICVDTLDCIKYIKSAYEKMRTSSESRIKSFG